MINMKASKQMIDQVNWANISDAWKRKRRTRLTYVDLFSGAGGISKGFEMAGMEGIYGLDHFDSAVQTYARNFDHPIFNGDIKSNKVKNKFVTLVNDRLSGRKLNILAGGFPCQGFSLSGHRVVSDPRNTLYLDMLDIVLLLKPDFVVLENVVGLRSMLNGGVEKKIINDYMECGYAINVTTLHAADYGVPQKRKRVIFIANKIGATNFHPKAILKESDYKTVQCAIEDLIDLDDDPEFNHVKTKHSVEMINRINSVPEGGTLYPNYADSWRKSPWNEPSCTIKENHGGVNLHPRRPRALTPRELARLQTFPDDFIFAGKKSKQLIQIGNAVPPILAKAIGLAIQKSYEMISV
ncbi:MAG: DNA cytosine methyltransferase [Candidatus Neomarinimicrobiota bacterium]|nr:DNA cytosine methyltransferase [Candidatus Neomarinimicrobiota bacterium]